MSLLRCPSCGGEMSLDVLITHNELRQAMVDLVEKSLSVGSLVLRYVGLFRPAHNRMSGTKFANLVIQLTPDVQRCAITYRGREWQVPLPAWEQGLQAMLDKAAGDKLTLPLENHNYLYSVLAGLADKVEAAAERDVEQERQIPRPIAVAGPVDVATAATRGMPDHIRQQAEEIRQRAREAGLAAGAADA